MKKNIVVGALTALVVVVLGYALIFRSSTTKLFTREVFTGYNQVYPVSGGSIVVYSGHNFIYYSPQSDEAKIVSPDTGSKLDKISVSSDGTSAVAFVGYVDPSDILATQYGVQDNSWVRFNLSKNSIKLLDVESEYVFALNNEKAAALVTTEQPGIEEDNSAPAVNHFVVIDDNGEEEFAEYSETPSQVRESNGNLIVKSRGVTRSSVYRVKKESADLLTYVSTRSAISLDGSYFYSVDSKEGESGLVDREAMLKIYKSQSGKLESTTNLGAGVSVHWGADNQLALSSTNENTVKVISYPSNKQKSYSVNDDLSGVCIPTENGMLVITGASINLATSTKESNPISTDKIKEVESDTTYSIHKTGKMIFVFVYNSNVPEIISSIKATAGDSYPRIGFVFDYTNR